VTLRARWVTLRARWVTLRARWVTLRARWVTLRARWLTLRARWETWANCIAWVTFAAIKQLAATAAASESASAGALILNPAAAAGPPNAFGGFGPFAAQKLVRCSDPLLSHSHHFRDAHVDESTPTAPHCL
jgi:hypothetical protein